MTKLQYDNGFWATLILANVSQGWIRWMWVVLSFVYLLFGLAYKDD